MEAYRKIYPLEFYRHFLSQEVRPDKRSLFKSRKVKVTVGSISTADASAFVKVGHTSVIAGVIAEIGTKPPQSAFEARKVPNISKIIEFKKN